MSDSWVARLLCIRRKQFAQRAVQLLPLAVEQALLGKAMNQWIESTFVDIDATVLQL